MTRPQGSKLRMDMTVPLWGVVVAFFALLGQAGTIIWGASNLNDQIKTMNDRVDVIEGKLKEGENDHATLARVDERTQGLAVVVNRIDDRLSQQEGRR